jgi:alcohol dehydrogenase
MSKLKISHPTFQHPRSVTYGTGAIRSVLRAEDTAGTVWFLTSQAAVHEVLRRGAEKAGIDFDTIPKLVKPAGEPSIKTLEKGADFLRTTPHRRIVAVGGGSLLDWCRLAWAACHGLLQPGETRLTSEPTADQSCEFWLVPTTCATGAEAATVAVYSNAEGDKLPVVSPSFLASQVVLDGQFLEHLAPGSLERSLCDTLSHAIESFVSIVPGRLAKEAAVSALWLILENYDQQPSSSRNDRMMEAGFLGGLAASHCSVGVVHAFAHTAAREGVSHSLGNALGLIAGIHANADTAAMRQLLTRCGMRAIDELVDRLRPLVEKAVATSTPHTLKAQLLDEAGRREFRERMARDVCIRSNPRPLKAEELDQFLDRVLAIAGN